jgi:F-type H+-transporting ATPase subunit b
VVQIDYFTFIAQVVNFLVLIILLRFFLYKRIIEVMDEREKRITLRLQEAKDLKTDAEKEIGEYQKNKQELSQKREAMLIEARKEAQTVSEELIKKAKSEVNESKNKWLEEVERQKKKFLSDMRRRSGEKIYFIASRVLEDLANDELELHIINTFIKRLYTMGEKEKEAIKGFIRMPQEEIIIKSSFAIQGNLPERIKEAVRDQISEEAKFRFEIEPDLLCGIELHTHDRQISWSLGSYLDTLEEDISRSFDMRGKEELAVKSNNEHNSMTG